jgi:hypothetical protein
VALIAAGAAVGDVPPDVRAYMAETYLKLKQENTQALRSYEYHSRVEAQQKGKPVSTDLYLVRFDQQGQIQQNLVGQEKAAVGKKNRFMPVSLAAGVVKRTKRGNRRKDFEGSLQYILETYDNIPPENIKNFFANATIQPGESDMSGTVRVSGTHLMLSGDSMTLWMNPKTEQTRQMRIDTIMQNKPMTILTQYGKLPDGLVYEAKTTLEIASQEMVITTDNFQFERQKSL